MSTELWVSIGIAVVGWLTAAIQYRINRRHQLADKLFEKRFDVYTDFLGKMDEISANTRTDPSMIFGVATECLAGILSGNEEQRQAALLQFNSQIIEFTKNVSQASMMLNQELNKLKLVCSEQMLVKIHEYKNLADGHIDDFRGKLSLLSSNNDIQETANHMKQIAHDERVAQMSKVWKDIELLMRAEIHKK